jgi:hypothetical protein
MIQALHSQRAHETFLSRGMRPGDGCDKVQGRSRYRPQSSDILPTQRNRHKICPVRRLPELASLDKGLRERKAG